MARALRGLFLLAAFFVLSPVAAQDMEHPPPPKAAPLVEVQEMPLPRAGGVMVFGATGELGTEIVRALREQGVSVSAMVRPTSDTAQLEELGAKLAVGDAMTYADVLNAMRSYPLRAVVSTLGGRRGDYRVDVGGNKNVIDAAAEVGVPRFVLVTAIGSGEGSEALPWYIDLFMGYYFEAKSAAELVLKNSGLDFTIVRPGWLIDAPASGAARLIGDIDRFSWIARADLGAMIAAAIEDETTYGKALTAFDPERTSILSLFD